MVDEQDLGSVAAEAAEKEKIRNSARTVIDTCMQLRGHENLLIVTDPHTAEIGQALYEAGSLVSDRVLMVMMPSTHRHGQEPPNPVADMMRRQHVVIAATRYSLTHTRARLIASKDGARIATMPGVNRAMFIEGGMTADFDTLQTNIATMGKVLRRHRNVIIEGNGTELSFDISGRWNLEDNGICNRPGQVTNLPAGKIFSQVKSDTVTGSIEIDGAWDSIALKSPISIVFDQGRLIGIEGPEDGHLKEQIDELTEDGMDTIQLVEFGFGMNPQARITGNALEDEKVLGSCYIVLKQAKNRRGIELRSSAVSTKSTVRLGEQCLIDSGEFQSD